MSRMSSTSSAARGVASVVTAIAALTIALHGRQPPAYQDLAKLFTDFVTFERPPAENGDPDYTAATIAARRIAL